MNKNKSKSKQKAKSKKQKQCCLLKTVKASKANWKFPIRKDKNKSNGCRVKGKALRSELKVSRSLVS